MANILSIIQEGDPVLRKRAEEVKDLKSPEIQQLILDMVATMKAAGGVGLAAPQVSKSLRIFVANVAALEGRASPNEIGREEKQKEKIYVFINPEIKDISPDKSPFEEGCLSVEKIWGSVIRPKKLTIRALDENGKPIKIRAKGLLARIIQHEMDHLNGMLFIDKAEKLYKLEEKR